MYNERRKIDYDKSSSHKNKWLGKNLRWNIAVNTLSNDIAMVVFTVVMILAGAAVSIILMGKINLMEVE